MKIVVLDGYTLNPGDISWKGFEEIGKTIVYDRTKPEEVLERAKDAEIILTNKVIIDRNLIKKLPSLKYIGVLAAGYNVVDIEAARELGVAVTNTPNYGSEGVAQMAFAHLLEITNNVALHNKSVKNGDWSRSSDFCYWKKTIIGLKEKTLGIIGYGNIGKEMKDIAAAFGMKVIVNSRTPKVGVENVILDELLKNADVISLHCPLTPETKGIINKNSIEKMKDGVIIINTSRGPLIEEKDLAEAIKNGKVYAAGLDVLSEEPPKEDEILIKTDGVNITPHIAWASKDSRENLMDIAVDNLCCFIRGETKNRVD